MKRKMYPDVIVKILSRRVKVKAIMAMLACFCCSSFFASASQIESIEITADQQQNIVVNGKISDRNGEALIGVTVSVKGTTTGGLSDFNGLFTLNVPSPNSTLVISYIGYTSQEIVLNGRTDVNIVLDEDAKALDEVVITALGIRRQAKSLGYSTTNVSGSDFTESRDINIGNALTGKIAGLTVSNNATGATGSSRVIIRGNASLSGNNQPLYVIDGVPFDNTNHGSAGTWGGVDTGDGLSNISPDDIQDIQVLKGVAASALYGYRGGNGAILITTKSGTKSTGIGIDFNNNLTFNKVYDYRDFQKVYGQGSQGQMPTSGASARQTAASSWGGIMSGDKTAINFLGDEYAYKYRDNWKEFYKTGVTNQTSVAVSGSSDKVLYRVGLTNLVDKGILPNSDFKQQGINLNTTYNITSKLQLNLTANYMFDKATGKANLSDGNANPNATLLYLANSFDVNWLRPRVNENNQELIPGNSVYFNNPYFMLYDRKNSISRNRLTGGLTLRYEILDWLYAQGQVTRDGYIMNVRQVQPTGAAADIHGFMEEYERNFEELNASYLIGANRNYGNFSLGANIGGNIQRNVNKSYGSDGDIRPFLIPGFYSGGFVGNRPYARKYEEYRVNSMYATADVGFKDYLFLNLTGRNDWFSTLSPDSNSYFYPSASTSFVFSDAFKMPSWIYSGKARLSYAQGSNGTSPYKNALTYGLDGFNIQGQLVGKVNNNEIPNAYLKPVKIQEWEAGVNVQFFENRLGFDIAVYSKKTSDDIVSISTSSASGYNSAIMNIGEIRNRGIEGMIHAVPVVTRDFIWNTSLNMSFNKSEVLYLGEGVGSMQIDGASARNGNAVISHVLGSPYGQIVGYKYRQDEAGNRVYDSQGLPLASEKVQNLGNSVPKITGGFRNEISFKDFTIMALLDFKFGAKLFSGTNYNLYGNGLHKETLKGREEPYVGLGVNEAGAENTTGVTGEKYWKAVVERNITEEFIYNANFIKLRELSFGYNLPKSILKDGFVKSANISLVGRNLWTIFKNTPNIDPESAYNSGNGQGLELNGYPTTRSFGFNLNLKF